MVWNGVWVAGPKSSVAPVSTRSPNYLWKWGLRLNGHIIVLQLFNHQSEIKKRDEDDPRRAGFSDRADLQSLKADLND